MNPSVKSLIVYELGSRVGKDDTKEYPPSGIIPQMDKDKSTGSVTP